jgi:hypothetical protein
VGTRYQIDRGMASGRQSSLGTGGVLAAAVRENGPMATSADRSDPAVLDTMAHEAR